MDSLSFWSFTKKKDPKHPPELDNTSIMWWKLLNLFKSTTYQMKKSNGLKPWHTRRSSKFKKSRVPALVKGSPSTLFVFRRICFSLRRCPEIGDFTGGSRCWFQIFVTFTPKIDSYFSDGLKPTTKQFIFLDLRWLDVFFSVLKKKHSASKNPLPKVLTIFCCLWKYWDVLLVLSKWIISPLYK